MSARRLLLLALLAMLLLGLTLALSDRGEQQIAVKEHWLPDLGQQLQQVQRIEVYAGSTAASVSLAQRDARWRVEQLDSYPADVAQLAALMQQFSQARLLEPRTADPDRHSRLQVDDPRGADAQGVLVTLSLHSKPVQQLVLGQRSELGTVVRQLDDPQAWLVDQRLAVPTDPMDWVEDLILNLPATDIEEVRFIGGEEPYRLQRDEARQWQVIPLPEGRQPLAQTSLARVPEAVSGLRVRNIARLELEDQTPETLAQVVFVFSDTAELAIRRLHVGDTDWVSIEVTPPELDATLTDWQALAERLAPWRYQLPGYKMGAIFRAREALLQEQTED